MSGISTKELRALLNSEPNTYLERLLLDVLEDVAGLKPPCELSLEDHLRNGRVYRNEWSRFSKTLANFDYKLQRIPNLERGGRKGAKYYWLETGDRRTSEE